MLEIPVRCKTESAQGESAAKMSLMCGDWEVLCSSMVVGQTPAVPGKLMQM